MAEEFKYSFGVHSDDDLKRLVEKYAFEVQNVSFEKTHALMELCVGILCKLEATRGIRLDLQEIMEIWKKVNKNKEFKSSDIARAFEESGLPTEVVKIELNPEIEKEVTKYVLEI